MAFNRASSSSSFSSSFTHQWAQDVFLSFRGEDTRNNFTAHLHKALVREGINTYIDNDLERGENISPALLKTIKESRISIIVLSQNYASSSWCLDELVTILECKETKGQIILPVFYKVLPSDVGHQSTKSFKEAFAKHEERFKDNQMKVQRWKTALTKVAKLSGYDLGNRKEPEFIQEIIERVNLILVKETKFQVGQDLVGRESSVQAVKLLLDIEKRDSTCIVGIFGTGGIGKTILAEVIYNSIASQFEGSCFLRGIRETSTQPHGLTRLQKELLSNILSGSSLMFDDDNQGVTLIKKRLCLKRILLVLDDVDDLAQLEKLAGKTNWFGLGSRIIITTRDKHLLCAHGVDSAYEVKLLDHDKALQLFSRKAFNSDKPNDSYEEVTEDAVSYCGGLPLALTVLGSALKERDIAYWKSKLDKDKRIPDKKIQEILRISYDGLEVTQQDIFLDIACFFNRRILEYGFFPYHGIQELVNKSLISSSLYDKGILIMHDLLQELGREIVQEESRDPGERSRLWFHEDVRQVLEAKTGTNKVEGILINFPKPDQIHLSPKAFKKMKRLRLIIIRNAHFSEEPTFFSNELRLIDWTKYPGESFSSNFCGRNLVVLRMLSGHLRELKGLQHFQKLTTMDFSYCDFLEKIPDVSSISNLNSLKLHDCKNLVEVHCSVGRLDKLVELEVIYCENLVSFPKSLKLRFLQSICLCCPKLKNFPEIECKMECLEHIFSDCNIKELNSSICLLLEDDRQSKEKSSISSGTELLQHLPSTNTSDSNDDSFSNVFPELRNLNLPYCTLSESNFFRAFGCASKLSTLDLQCSDIVSLPRDIESFVGLEYLHLRGCKQLKEILGLPRNVKDVKACDCVSLEIMRWDPPEPVGVEAVSPTQQPSNRFLQWRVLFLKGCIQLREISKLPPSITNVDLSGCTSLERLPFNNIWNDLPKLYWIDVSNCPEHIGNALQIQLFSEGYHNKFREFLFQLEGPRIINSWNDYGLLGDDLQIQLSREGPPRLRFECIYPGNMIPDCFSYCEKDLNTNSCEIDINEPQPFDFENTIFAFSAVIGFGTEDGEDEDGDGFGTEDGEDGEDEDGDGFGTEDDQYEDRVFIRVGVINDGQKIYSTSFDQIKIGRSDHVWLHYEVPYHSQLKTNNFRVEFTLVEITFKNNIPLKSIHQKKKKPLKSVFFKSCGFDLVRRNEEKAVDSMDGIQHSKRCRDDDDDGNLESKKRQLLEFQMLKKPLGESQLHQSNHPQQLQPPFHVFL